MTVKINVDDGAVTFAKGSIERGTDKASFLNSSLGLIAEKWHAREALEVFRFLPEPGVIATADFRGGRIASVSVLFSLPDDSDENRSRNQEFKRKELHDEWLRTELGEPPYYFSWGQVVSAFYDQHCESDIMVVYGR